MDQIKQLISDAQAAFSRLTSRERKMLLIAGGVISLFILFLITFSFSTSAAKHRRGIENKLTQLQEVQTLAASYRDAEEQRQAVERQLTSSDVRLGAYIEEKGNAVGLEIPTMSNKGPFSLGDGKISESTVDFALNDIKLKQLTDFLTTVESGPGVVKVKFIRIEPKTSNETLTAWVNVATYQMKP